MKLLPKNHNYIIHFKRMIMMMEYFEKKSKINKLYLPEYIASKNINQILKNNKYLSPKKIKGIENELLNVTLSNHYGGSHWHDYEIHTNSIIKYKSK